MRKFSYKTIFFISAILLGFVSISCSNGAESQTTEQSAKTYSNVSVSDLNGVVEGGGDAIILDVRTPSEVSEGYVKNAQNLDINGSTFKQQAEQLDKSKTVYVYCRSGHRSQIASNKLIEMGFSDVRNVEGGFLAWADKGYQIIK